MKTRIINWLLVITWAGFIFFLSHQPELKSGLSYQWDFILRKIAHISEYAILTFLLIRALTQYQLSKKRILLFSLIIALLYALSDEYHQTFIFGRHGVLRDVLIDSLGIISIIWIFFKFSLKTRY